MYKIKQKQEDFIVKEVSNIKLLDKGDYAVFLLKKKNLNTIDVVKKIADFLRIKQREVGFAGTKDKIAVTEQFVSVSGVCKDRLCSFELKNVELKFVGYAKESIFLGDLVGNEFIINVYADNVNDFISKYKDLNAIKIINYFGEQRFSKNNVDVGRFIVKNKFKEAVELICKTNNFLERTILTYLKPRANDYVGALRTVPEKLLKLFVHAYQSQLWNDIVKKYVKDKDIETLENTELPIIGFGSIIKNDVLRPLVEAAMEKEQLTLRDFIIRPLPHLSQEGDYRNIFTEAKDFKILEHDDDFIKISFRLDKGCYATEVVRQLFTLSS